MAGTGIHDRLSAAIGNRTFRHLAELTGTNHETVRRYLQGQAPSAAFLATLARTLGINAHWLLTGVGPMWANEVRSAALREADAPELMTVMAEAIETLIGRVDRIERYVQSIEARLRHRSAQSPVARTTTQASEDQPQASEDHEQDPSETRAVVSISTRARRVADAVPQRPPQDDR